VRFRFRNVGSVNHTSTALQVTGYRLIYRLTEGLTYTHSVTGSGSLAALASLSLLRVNRERARRPIGVVDVVIVPRGGKKGREERDTSRSLDREDDSPTAPTSRTGLALEAGGA